MILRKKVLFSFLCLVSHIAYSSFCLFLSYFSSLQVVQNITKFDRQCFPSYIINAICLKRTG
jgi:hypothetical protein